MYILICEHCGRLLIKPRLKRKGVSKFNYCNKHRKQLDRYGKFLDNNQLFKNDKNRIILHENYAEVELRNRYGEINGIALIDLEDVGFVKQYKWNLHNQGYMYNHEIGLFHKYKTGFELTDHINRNRLDNRKENLREATKQINQINRSLQKNNSSGITGVGYNKQKQLWVSRLEKDGVIIIYECYENKEDAIRCRLQGEKDYFGEYAPQKHLFKQYGIE